MLDSAKKIYKIGFTASLASSIAASVLLTLAIAFDYESNLGHFTVGSILNHAAGVLYLVSVISSALTASLTRKKASADTSALPKSIFSRSVAILTATFFLAVAVRSAVFGSLAAASKIEVFAVIAVITLLPYLVNYAFDFSRSLAPLFGVLTIIWAAASAMQTYFDSTFAINSPIKAYLLTLAASYLLFFAGEARTVLCRREMPTQIFLSLAAVSVGSIAPALLISVFTRHTIGRFDLITAFAFTALWIFAITRGISLSHAMREYSPKDDAHNISAEAPADKES